MGGIYTRYDFDTVINQVNILLRSIKTAVYINRTNALLIRSSTNKIVRRFTIIIATIH